MKILVASMIPTHPTIVGNRARIKRLCAALQTMGHEVHFAFIPREKGNLDCMSIFFGKERLHVADFTPTFSESLASRLFRRALAIIEHDRAYSYKVDDWYAYSLDSFFQKLAEEHRFDAVIAEYVFLSRALQFFSKDSLKIIDTHDRFSDRHKVFLAAGQWPGWYSTTLSEELKGLRRSDAVLAIQEREQEFFAQHLTDRSVITVGHIVPTVDPITNWANRVKYSMLMVGSDNPPNRAALMWFLQDIMPNVRLRIPEACLLLAGGICESIGSYPGVIKLGIIDDIATAHEQAWIGINPMINGTGLSIKGIEALGFGLPLITTATGSRGLERYSDSGFIQVPDHNSEAMSAAIFSLLSNTEERNRMSREACAFAKEWNRQATDRLKTLLSRGKNNSEITT